MSTTLFGTIVKESKALANEVGPIKCHLKRVTNGMPILPIKTIEEDSLIRLVAEVTTYFQIYNIL